jgi:uncharacterized protein
MNQDPKLSEEFLNAFIDNELTATERARAMEQISNDPQLKKQVCELHMLKEMVRSSYHAQGDNVLDNAQPAWPYLRHTIAACCLMIVGVLVGWLGHSRIADDHLSAVKMVSLDQVAVRSDHVVVHIDTASPQVFQQALDQAEQLLGEASDAGRPIQVHLAANSHGIDLFRTSTSPYAGRIQTMQQRYPNFTLIGCAQTLRRLQDREQDTTLLPHVAVVTSVLDEVVTNLRDGWTYLKVASDSKPDWTQPRV